MKKKNFNYKEPVSKHAATAKWLIIVESPSKCSKIESYLGQDYSCIASLGHIRQIDGLCNIDTKHGFEPTFSMIESKKTHIEHMRTIIARFSKNNIILASDDDREGEAIAWHICDVFQLPIETTQRILFHEITKTAIQTAIQNPTVINMDKVKAQNARQVLDIIVGFKVSPFLWKYIYSSKDKSLSAGRCQTPALRLIYDNQQEIQAQNNMDFFYKITGTFFERGLLFTLNTQFSTEIEVEQFLTNNRTHQHILTVGSQKESTNSPPKPFKTSALLQTASSLLNMSPSETMKLCQELYQAGHITYMRTESSQYSRTFLEKAESFIKSEYKDTKYIGNIEELENNQAANPHEAIRVTDLGNKTITRTDKNARLVALYEIIWKNTLTSCMSKAIYSIYPLEISAPLELQFLHNIEIPVFYGWRIVDTKKKDQANDLQYVKVLQNPVQYQKIESSLQVTSKVTRYTEASLVKELETLGIGRPSTYATIIETIQDRGYVKKQQIEGITKECTNYRLQRDSIVIERIVEKKTFGSEKNKLVLQMVGKVAIEFLITYFNKLFSYDYASEMENKLDKINADNWSDICKDCYQEIKLLAKELETIKKQSYKIDEHHEYVFGKYGPAIKYTSDDGSIEYSPAKQEPLIDMQLLKAGKYSLDDLIDNKQVPLGLCNGLEAIAKQGKYGNYISWNGKNYSIKDKTKSINNITLDDLRELETGKEDKKDCLRTLTPNMSIRKGKFGPYVFYKCPGETKPKCLNIKKFKENMFDCSPEVLIKWVCNTYNLQSE